jgi:hypothetical protein
MDRGHLVAGFVDRGQAIDPSIHIVAVEVWKAKGLLEDMVK